LLAEHEMATKTTKTSRHRKNSYRAIVTIVDDESADVEVQKETASGWVRLALGMFDVGGLDLGDDHAKVPSDVYERLHDSIEAILKDEDEDEEDGDDDSRSNPSRKSPTSALRAAIKAVDPDARVSGVEEDGAWLWTVRTENKLDEVRAVLTRLGLHEYVKPDTEGSRWNWTYVLYVAKKE
jgi:hypothetical protein